MCSSPINKTLLRTPGTLGSETRLIEYSTECHAWAMGNCNQEPEKMGGGEELPRGNVEGAQGDSG